MKVLITGASGLVGGRLSNYLEKNKMKVVKVSRGKKNFEKINWESKKKLKNLCRNINVIVNCAGVDVHQSRNLKNTLKVNAEFPFRLFRAANENNVNLFIFLSTYHVYNFKNKIINEDSKTNKKDNYTRSKIIGENKLLSFKNKKTKVLIIRACNLFGYPYYKNNNCWNLIINSMIKDLILKKKFTIKSKFNVYRYYSSVSNFCNFLKKILDDQENLMIKKDKEIINFTSDKSLNLRSLVSYMKKTRLFKKSKIIFQNKLILKKKIYFSSKFANKFYNKKDKFFLDEVKKIKLYVRKNFNK